MTVVFYHKNCQDGFGAAWAAWKALGDSASYVPVQYSEPLPEVSPRERVYFCDFCPTLAELKDLSGIGCSVTVLDHHKTAVEVLTPKNIAEIDGLDAIFDMDRAGAGITFDYFHPSKKRPLVINLIEDRDLWRFRNDLTKSISTRLNLLEKDFATWDAFILSVENDHVFLPKIKYEGDLLLQSESKRADSMARKAVLVDFLGHTIPVLNVTELISEIGQAMNELYDETPFSLSFFVNDKGSFQISLRSNRSDFDVSVIAKRFGGGGHRGAAGFRLSFSDFQKELPGIFVD